MKKSPHCSLDCSRRQDSTGRASNRKGRTDWNGATQRSKNKKEPTLRFSTRPWAEPAAEASGAPHSSFTWILFHGDNGNKEFQSVVLNPAPFGKRMVCWTSCGPRMKLYRSAMNWCSLGVIPWRRFHSFLLGSMGKKEKRLCGSCARNHWSLFGWWMNFSLVRFNSLGKASDGERKFKWIASTGIYPNRHKKNAYNEGDW